MQFSFCNTNSTNLITFSTAALTVFTCSLLFVPCVQATEHLTAAESGSFTAEQQEAIGQIAATYLSLHPEYLIAAQENLRQNQLLAQQQKIALSAISSSSALLHDINTPSFGPENAAVALITFTDYQSKESRGLEPIISKTLLKHPQIRLVSKEFPIFSGQWPTSGIAAIAALHAWQEKGSKGYYAFRNALYKKMQKDKVIMMEDISYALQIAGVTPLKSNSQNNSERISVNTNLKLGQDLGMTMAPTVIVMPQNGGSVNNITAFTQVPSEEQLARAIALATDKVQ